VALSFYYDASQDDVPDMEILRRMRDLFVTEVRTSLLSGLFRDNPDSLEVYGELESKEVTVMVVDKRNNKTFGQRVPFAEFAASDNPDKDAADQREATPAREETVPQGDLKAPNDQSLLEEGLRMPRLTLTKKISADEFRNRTGPEDLRSSVSSKVRGMANKFVTEYLAAKASQALT